MLARVALRCGAFSAVALGPVLGGCAGTRDLTPPQVLVSPYAQVRGQVLIAVAPPINESGTTVADPLEVGDALVAAVGQTRGLAGVPMDRTLAGMGALGLRRITSAAEARALAGVLGADGVLVGSITAYDPYDPPVLGLNLSLYGASDAIGAPDPMVDPTALAGAFTDAGVLPAAGRWDAPLSAMSGHYDASAHDTLMSVRQFAEGRHDPVSAMGWKRYTASMELYTEFAAWRAFGSLLDEERLRLARVSSSSAVR